ncbi:exonuclease subunit SbcD [Staphylococcus aureus]|uniref:exonuclease subunit SbcD n=1 Tax=Staphylococcus warneri TaxID=1292 RepID=UPI00188013DD|nr:exonuclease subunit SbcD [Staphylococcus warneri]MBE9428577.1 exonuclease SbcCD subunit D [Staphylococcus epidermidis]MDU9351103.1 exonuclease SbcCD subunit D [Staphylococcus warneri]
MKVIHTADWHLGRILNGKQLLEDQRYVLDQFINQMKEEKPDIIVIAGDLYDTTYPGKDTIKLFEETISKLNIDLKIPIILISGNHDGKERLNYGASWFEHSNLYIRTKLENMTQPIRINGINFYTLPFATVAEVQHYFKDDSIQTHQQALDKCITSMSEILQPQDINVLIGHLTVQGGKTSDSERPLTIGTVETVERKSFNIFDFVMLGHLHHPFSINEDTIKYSGSLLQYSFSEVGQPKGYRVVKFNQKNDIQDYFVPIEPLRKLEIVTGDYQDVIQEKVNVSNKNNYIHFKLRNMAHISDPIINLKQIYPNTLALTNETFEHHEAIQHIEIKKEDDLSIINNFYKTITNEQLTDVQEKKMNQIINDLIRKED